MKKLVLYFSLLFCLQTAFAASPPPVYTGGVLPGPLVNKAGEYNAYVGQIESGSGETYVVERLIPGITNGLLMVFLTICVAALIIAGIYFVISSGDSEMKQKAKDIIFWTAVGAIIAILAVAVVRMVIGLNFSFSV